MVNGFSFHTGNCRDTEALTLRMGPFETRCAEASRGHSRRDEREGGFRQQQPGRVGVANRAAQDGKSTQVGRSQGVPSTLPNPGESEPV